jgi:hypothetical protein
VESVFIHQVRGGKAGSGDPRVRAAASFLDHAETLLGLGKLRAEAVEAVRLEVGPR